MSTTYEKVAEECLVEGGTLWSIYRFSRVNACVTDLRVFFIDADSNFIPNIDISFKHFKAIATRHYSSSKSLVDIHFNAEVYRLTIEKERVDRFMNDICLIDI